MYTLDPDLQWGTPEYMRAIRAIAGSKPGKARWKGVSRAARSLNASLMARKRRGLPAWSDADREAFLRGWEAGYEAGFEIAAGRK